MSDIPAEISHDQHAVRRQKLADLRAAGVDPFSANVSQSHFSAAAIKAYVEGQDNAVTVSVAGRLVVIRDMGKSQFVKILDQDGQIQIYVKKDVLGDEAYAAFKKLDLGDFIGITGTLFKTKAGEITVRADKITLVAKALRPLPEKWHGLTDPEQIYRQRYLDLIVNPESRVGLRLRSKIVAAIRRFIDGRDFIEVETPVLQSVAGGAAARPFVTHHQALGVDFFLRISLELYLKRLLVGGYDRVYEIGRNFRNEGISRRHNPEFTMLEVYQAYSDYRGMMALIKAMLTTLCRDVLGTMKIKHAASGEEIDFGGDWREVTYKDLIRTATGDPDWFSRSKVEHAAAAQKLGLQVEAQWEDFEITNEIFSKRVEPTLIQPTFVLNLPKELCPLATRPTRRIPPPWTSSNCASAGWRSPRPIPSRTIPTCSGPCSSARPGRKSRASTRTSFSPPWNTACRQLGGMGVGIDRLCILLTGAESIRDVILFPQLRPTAPTPAAP